MLQGDKTHRNFIDQLEYGPSGKSAASFNARQRRRDDATSAELQHPIALEHREVDDVHGQLPVEHHAMVVREHLAPRIVRREAKGGNIHEHVARAEGSRQPAMPFPVGRDLLCAVLGAAVE
ncbi:MAG: hypothetical protein ABI664_15700 [bacterium]